MIVGMIMAVGMSVIVIVGMIMAVIMGVVCLTRPCDFYRVPILAASASVTHMLVIFIYYVSR